VQASARKYAQVQASAGKCRQVQASAGKCRQVQASAGKCATMGARLAGERNRASMGDAHAAVLRQLYDAAQRGDVGQVQALLAVLPADCVAPVGCALMAAVCNDHADVVGAFVARDPSHMWMKPCGATWTKTCGTTLLELAARHDSVHVVAVLAAAKSVHGAHSRYEPPLYIAAREGQLSSVSLLLAMNPSGYVDGLFPSALRTAANNGHADVAERLLRAKADQHLRDCFGQTPVYLAATCMHQPALRVLLDAHADVNPPSPCHSPLFGAALHPRLLGIFQLLLGARADVNATTTNGRTALSTAVANACPDTVVKLLLRAKAEVNIAAVTNGMTALHLAATQGRRGTVNLLVRAKANVRAKAHVHAETGSGCTAATLARVNKHFELAAYLEAIAGL